jgi:autotransporter-associated beta strand protein
VLNGGVVQVGNNQAFSTGGITVGGSSSISATAPISLATRSRSTAPDRSRHRCADPGRGDQRRRQPDQNRQRPDPQRGSNTYTGITSLGAGTLRVGNNNALGTGAHTSNGTSLDSTGNVTLGNNVSITGALNVLGNNLTLGGIVSGTGADHQSGTPA